MTSVTPGRYAGSSRHLFCEISPKKYAQLSLWVYDPKKHPLPKPFKQLGEIIKKTRVAFGYVQANVSINGKSLDMNVLVIRGTDNFQNQKHVVEIGLTGKIPDKMSTKAVKTLNFFEREFGACHVATGHSLGGLLVEPMVEKKPIFGVTFNAYANHKSNKIVAFRLSGELAKAKYPAHTDRLIKTKIPNLGLVTQYWYHRQVRMLKYLKGSENRWKDGEVTRAKTANSNY